MVPGRLHLSEQLLRRVAADGVRNAVELREFVDFGVIIQRDDALGGELRCLGFLLPPNACPHPCAPRLRAENGGSPDVS